MTKCFSRRLTLQIVGERSSASTACAPAVFAGQLVAAESYIKQVKRQPQNLAVEPYGLINPALQYRLRLQGVSTYRLAGYSEPAFHLSLIAFQVSKRDPRIETHTHTHTHTTSNILQANLPSLLALMTLFLLVSSRALSCWGQWSHRRKNELVLNWEGCYWTYCYSPKGT